MDRKAAVEATLVVLLSLGIVAAIVGLVVGGLVFLPPWAVITGALGVVCGFSWWQTYSDARRRNRREW